MLSPLLAPTTTSTWREVSRRTQSLVFRLFTAFQLKCVWCLLFLVFSGMSLQKPSEPQQSWPEFTTTVPSSIWDIPSPTDPLHSWTSTPSSTPTSATVRSFLWYDAVRRYSDFLFMILLNFFPLSHSWETAATRGLQPHPSAAPFGQRVQSQP